MSVSCEIEFENNPRKIVYAGQLLRGTVRMNLMKKTNVRYLYIRITGKIFAQWYEGRTPITIKESYLDKKMYFVEETTGEMKFEPGTYNYTFEFMLPSDIPSSIEGTHGHIKYSVRVLLDVPGWLNTKEFNEEFTLIKALNLNEIPHLRRPLMIMQTKKMNSNFFDWFGSSTLTVGIWVPITGYLPQQTFTLKVIVNNQSGVEISQFRISLIQLITYSMEINFCKCTNIYRKDEEKCLMTSTINGCGEHQNNTIHLAVDIPPTIPTEIYMSKNIKVTYSLRVKALTRPAICSNITLDLPIIIGSIPFEDYTEDNTQAVPVEDA